MPTDTLFPDDMLVHAAAALKSIAADKRCRGAFLSHPLVSELMAVPASRYVVAPDRERLLQRVPVLADKGYRIGIEYVGEEVDDPKEIQAIVDEYLALIDELPSESKEGDVQIGFDLSNLGLLVSKKLSMENLRIIANAASKKSVAVMLSMERSSFVEDIIGVFSALAEEHDNIGITLQAHLHRTADDLGQIVKTGRKIRLVKGVYRESREVALPRGRAVDDRYVDLVRMIVECDGIVACATHDEDLINCISGAGLLSRICELEMLHGVRPKLLRTWRAEGFKCRVSAVYGRNWFLHFLHRLAEYPPNILVALADYYQPERIRFGELY
jgi:proline dehydrogenase